MKKRNSNLFIISSIVVVVVIALLIFGFSGSEEKTIQSESMTLPEKVIESYFSSWDNGDYEKMYDSISDGFKKIDPDAKDLDSFSNYASSQGISGVKINSIKETSNNGKTASVDYSVEFELDDGSTVPFSDSYTLRYRESDIVPGWKMIHPYGENIDIS